MRVLLADSSQYYPSSPLFAEALADIGTRQLWSWEFVDEHRILPTRNTWTFLRGSFEFLGLGRQLFNRQILKAAIRLGPDVVLVVKGAQVAPSTLKRVKKATGAILVNYATDDPFNAKVSSRNLLESIPLYDVYACTKRAIMDDVRRAGCEEVVYVPFGYKPWLHFPEAPLAVEEQRRFEADVVFIGGADDDRIPYFEHLTKEIRDIKLRLFGGYWNRHRSLSRYHQGFAYGRNYRLAIGGAKIVINLVRRANRDGHVMRSFEVPACGGFMLADRTDEHRELFEENREAAFFATPEEMVAGIEKYLADETARDLIRRAGCAKIRGGPNSYVDRLAQLLSAAKIAKSSGQDGVV
jgi:spore maturation protein CgeB